MRAAGIFYRPREAFYRVAAVVVLVVVVVLSVYFTARTLAGSRFLWTVAACTVVIALDRYGVSWRLVLALCQHDAETARSCLQAARIRRGWDSLARSLRLVEVQRGHEGPFHSTPDRDRTYVVDPHTRYRAPRLRIKPDPYGVVVTLKTVPGIGLTEIQRHIEHIADQWGAVRLSAVQSAPGRLRVRAVRRDPLAVPTSYTPDAAALAVPDDLGSVYLGEDEYAEPVNVRLSGVSGITIGGLPGYGKTSLLLGLISRLSPSPAVQFVVLDGKVDDPAIEGDYADVADRLAVAIGDDMKAANDVLVRLVELRRARSRSIRAVLGVVNVWHVGFTADWPLLFVVIDEAHTFFATTKDGGPKDPRRERNVLADENARHVEDLIKKGRSVGIVTIVATQKQTGDAIPTFIRDVCAVSLAFACRTAEAAKAALGDDIKDYPEANPVTLQDPVYVGVCSMALEGRPGYIRVRTPYTPAKSAAAVAGATRDLCGRRGELPDVPDAAMMIAGSDGD